MVHPGPPETLDFRGLPAGITLALPGAVTGARDGRSEREDAEVEREILTFVAAHPRRGATWEGILDWWLMERALERETRRVERALTALVEAGWLRRRRDRDGRTHYALAAGREAEIRRRFGVGSEREPA